MKVVYVGQVVSEENKDNSIDKNKTETVVYKCYMRFRVYF